MLSINSLIEVYFLGASSDELLEESDILFNLLYVSCNSSVFNKQKRLAVWLFFFVF